MQLDQLKVLDTVVRTGSFRAAAEALHRAQSAVSYAITNLEADLGITLFSRDEYRPKLTPEGDAVLKKARALLAGADELQVLGKQLAQGWEPQVSLAVSALYPLEEITDIFRAFSTETPGTKLKLSIEVLAGADKLLADEVDLAFTEYLGSVDTARLEAIPAGTVELVLVAAPACPLAQLQRPLDPSDLLRHVQIVLSSTSKDTAHERAGIPDGAFTWSTSGFGAKKTLLLAGLGWGLMPRHLVAPELASGALVALDVPLYHHYNVPFFLMRRRGRAFGKGATRLWDIIVRTRCPKKAAATGG